MNRAFQNCILQRKKFTPPNMLLFVAIFNLKALYNFSAYHSLGLQSRLGACPMSPSPKNSSARSFSVPMSGARGQLPLPVLLRYATVFSTCPFVCPSVRLFIRPSVTNLWTLYFENEWTDFNANWHKSFPEARAWTIDLGGQEVKDQGHRRPNVCLEAWRSHHCRSLE